MKEREVLRPRGTRGILRYASRITRNRSDDRNRVNRGKNRRAEVPALCAGRDQVQISRFIMVVSKVRSIRLG